MMNCAMPLSMASAGRRANLQLVSDIGVQHDGAGNQLGKQQDERHQADDVLLRRHLAAVHIHYIALGLKGIETDAQRHRHARIERTQADDVQEKARILEVHQRAEIEQHRQHKPQPAPARRVPRHHQPESIVQPHGHQHQGNIGNLSPGIKKHAGAQQKQVLEAKGQQAVNDNDNGQKPNNEGQAGK